jgi:hypothetical protein
MDQSSGARPLFSDPVEARLSMRPFTLRQRRLVLRRVSAAGSALLTYIFKAILRSAPGSFGSALPPPSGFLSPRGARSTCATRCQVRPRNSPSVLGSPLPFGISRSLGLVAPNPIPDREACPCESPDFPSLPAAPEIISYHQRNGSSLTVAAHTRCNGDEPASASLQVRGCVERWLLGRL